MSLAVLLVLIVVFAFVVGHLLRRFTSRFATLSAVEYMVVGVAIGPALGWSLLTRDALVLLQPFFSLLLGLVGFVLGIRADRAMRSQGLGPASYSASIAVLIGFTVLLLPVLDWLVPTTDAASDFVIDRDIVRYAGKALAIHIDSDTLWMALGLAACATVCSSQSIRTLRNDRPGRVGDFLQAAARASQITSIVVLGLILAATRATSQANRFSMTVVEWSVAAGCLGIICGVLFTLFIGRESEPSRIFLAAVGLVTFASGIGSALGISPLFVNLLAGVVVANTSDHAEGVRVQLDRLQHPLFVLVLIFAGALWEPVTGGLWLLPVVYVLARWGLRRLFTRIAARHVVVPRLETLRLGNGLLSHGSLAVAVALNLAQRFPEWSAVILNTVLLGTLASDLVSRRTLMNVLTDAGEIVIGQGPSSTRPPASSATAASTSHDHAPASGSRDHDRPSKADKQAEVST